MLTNYNDQIKENKREGKGCLGYTLRLLPQKRHFLEHGHVQGRETDPEDGVKKMWKDNLLIPLMFKRDPLKMQILCFWWKGVQAGGNVYAQLLLCFISKNLIFLWLLLLCCVVSCLLISLKKSSISLLKRAPIHNWQFISLAFRFYIPYNETKILPWNNVKMGLNYII